MALKVIKELVDDLDGTPESVKPVKPVRWTFEGTQYEADYTDENREALRADLARYIESARVISRPKTAPAAHGVPGSKKEKARQDRAQLDHMREWLRAHGKPVSDFGRIPVKYEVEYHEYHDNLGKHSAEANGHEVEPPNLEGVPQFLSA